MDGKSLQNKICEICKMCMAGRIGPCMLNATSCPMDGYMDGFARIDAEATYMAAEYMDQESNVPDPNIDREIAFPPITRVYLAGPVDLVSRETATSWRKEVADILARHDMISYSPNMPWNVFINSANDDMWHHHSEWIDSVNREAIARCDLLFANLHRVTIGTVREIELARSLNIPVVAIIKEEKRMVCIHDLMVYKSIHDALRDILKFSPKGLMSNG